MFPAQPWWRLCPASVTSSRVKKDHTHGQHHITIPLHDPLRVGTLNAILKDVAEHAGLTRDEVAETLFG